MPLTRTSRPTIGPPLAGAAAMSVVGGSVAVSGTLAGAPFCTAQSARYAVASAILVLLTRASGRRVHRPRGTQWCWLAGVTVSGLVLFNIGLVEGSRHAEPAVLGVAVACVPILLAVLGPALQGRPPHTRAVVAAVVVTCGAGLVEGFGRADTLGLAWAVLVMLCEAGFTLLAVPVLAGHGPHGVSVHSTWMAAVVFAVIGAVREGPGAVAELSGGQWLATAYLAVMVTAVAFLLWYGCVQRIGPDRAGLLTGIAPIAAAFTGVLLGGPVPHAVVWLGVLIVATGLALGLVTPRRRVQTLGTAPHLHGAGHGRL